MDLASLVQLVRAPAALTVPGDTVAGGSVRPGLAASSVCLYWAGMALNDYADRELDARERPERPIPSGRILPGQALAVAAGLTTAGVALAGLSGGRRGLGVAAGLAGMVWAYDMGLKNTVLGPVAMAAARGLDVLLGGPASSPLAAASVAAHTLGVTTLSRGEVNGGSAVRSAVTLAATGVAAGLAAWHIARGGDRVAKLAGFGLLAGYAALVGRPQLAAARSRDAKVTRSAVGRSIIGLLPLQAALTAGSGRLAPALALAAAHPVAANLAKKVSPT
ncbi:transferase [Acrocarpospora corrugata]|uniref:Transferase n=1 Tax=Acrocarpospora corrugata TaxID=35763 RepID=A0A5M3VPK8_9ACTN|nr:UbiA family prenyltransferase [Acrocarpospora corrugata]GER98148.1 transferase [Acrocarpospora corrugata]